MEQLTILRIYFLQQGLKLQEQWNLKLWLLFWLYFVMMLHFLDSFPNLILLSPYRFKGINMSHSNHCLNEFTKLESILLVSLFNLQLLALYKCHLCIFQGLSCFSKISIQKNLLKFIQKHLLLHLCIHILLIHSCIRRI